MSESRLRILVACGAAGGISATFNAPITGVFFGFELILREFSIDALFPIIMAAVIADVIGQAFFGSGPIFSQMPHNLVIPHDVDYLLVALLAVGAALIGVGFKACSTAPKTCRDRLWKGRPEWRRPAVGGIALGAVLLALPQLYGVGYPVMTKAVVDHYVLWFLVLLALARLWRRASLSESAARAVCRSLAVRGGDGRDRVRRHRKPPLRASGGLTRHLRSDRHGRGLRRRRPSAAHLHRQRG